MKKEIPVQMSEKFFELFPLLIILLVYFLNSLRKKKPEQNKKKEEKLREFHQMREAYQNQKKTPPKPPQKAQTKPGKERPFLSKPAKRSQKAESIPSQVSVKKKQGMATFSWESSQETVDLEIAQDEISSSSEQSIHAQERELFRNALDGNSASKREKKRRILNYSKKDWIIIQSIIEKKYY